MARKDAAKASGLPVDRYRKEIGEFSCLFSLRSTLCIILAISIIM